MDAFVILKGYTFRYTKEAADYIPEPDFVTFIWKRHEKDGDGNGLEDRNRSESDVQGPFKSADGVTTVTKPLPAGRSRGCAA